MERLTMTSDKGGVAFTFDLDITCKPSEAQKILKLAQKLKEYEDIEEKITKKFAGCIDIKTILDSFCTFYDMQEINEELAQCTLLTNEDVLKYRQWKEAEERRINPGDTVYVIDEERDGVREYSVSKVTYGKYHDVVRFVGGSRFTVWGREWDEYLDKYLFENKEEAEQALVRMEKSHE